MFETSSYSQPLRAIGQALELLNVETFDMETEGDDFLVQGSVIVPAMESSAEAVPQNVLRHIWDFLPVRRNPEHASAESKSLTTTRVELRYTPKDLERLEQDGKAKRDDSHRMPDTPSLSQLLRTVGAYLNQKGARLMKISRNRESVTVEYQTPSGQQIEEMLDDSVLYNVWVRMYMKRADRN